MSCSSSSSACAAGDAQSHLSLGFSLLEVRLPILPLLPLRLDLGELLMPECPAGDPVPCRGDRCFLPGDASLAVDSRLAGEACVAAAAEAEERLIVGSDTGLIAMSLAACCWGGDAGGGPAGGGGSRAGLVASRFDSSRFRKPCHSSGDLVVPAYRATACGALLMGLDHVDMSGANTTPFCCDMGRQTGRQTDRQTDRRTDRQTDRQTDRHRQIDRQQ